MNRTQLFLLQPTTAQAAACRREAGLSRFAWNWGLRYCQLHYALFGGKPGYRRMTAYGLAKRWLRLKKKGSNRVPGWVGECSCHTPRQAFIDLERAFQAFFSGRRRHPTRRTKRHTAMSFGCTGDTKAFRRAGCRFVVPRMGLVRATRPNRYATHPKSGRIKFYAGRWWLSAVYEVPDPPKSNDSRPACGVDLGLTKFAAIAAEGGGIEVAENSRVFVKLKRRRQFLQRRLSRRSYQKTRRSVSRRREKAKLALAKHGLRERHARHRVLHDLTKRLSREFGCIAVEDLNIAGLTRTRLGKSVNDAAWGEFRRQLEYKAEATGTKLVFADRFFPSSKLCSGCGAKKATLPLSERTYRCDHCGLVKDRDENAALNLLRLAVESRAGRPEVKPVETTGSATAARRKQPRSTKREAAIPPKQRTLAQPEGLACP